MTNMKLKNKIFMYVSFFYWMIQVLLLFTVNGFDNYTLIVIATIMIALLVLGLIIRNINYRIVLSLILLIYSIVFCFMALPVSVFIYDISTKILIYAITTINFIVSILMLGIFRKKIEQ